MAWQPGDSVPRYHYRFHAPVQSEDGGYVHYVEFVELPGCGAQGSTRTEALANLTQVLPDYLAQLVKFGQPVPAAQPDGEVTVGGFNMTYGPLDDEEEAVLPNSPAEVHLAEARLAEVSEAGTHSANVLVGV